MPDEAMAVDLEAVLLREGGERIGGIKGVLTLGRLGFLRLHAGFRGDVGEIGEQQLFFSVVEIGIGQGGTDGEHFSVSILERGGRLRLLRLLREAYGDEREEDGEESSDEENAAVTGLFHEMGLLEQADAAPWGAVAAVAHDDFSESDAAVAQP